MQTRTLSTIVAVLLLAGVSTAQPGATEPGKPPAEQPAAKQVRPPIYDEQADARAQIAAALAEAKKENRRVLIQWGANWCGWCHLLHARFADPKPAGRNAFTSRDQSIAGQLKSEYDVVLVDIGRFDKNMDLATEYGAELKAHGVPFLTVLDADGKVVVNEPTGPLEGKTAEGGETHDPAKVMAFLTKHQAPYPQAADVIEAGLAKAKAEGKRVFLHFGAPWCGWCHRLEDWMAGDDVGAILAKDFVDVKIDEDRMVGASEVEARFKKPGDSGIPWFVFLDATGKAIVDSTGPEGNTGFPASDPEIEHFVTMLNAAAQRITPTDIAALRKSLVSARDKK